MLQVNFLKEYKEKVLEGLKKGILKTLNSWTKPFYWMMPEKNYNSIWIRS